MIVPPSAWRCARLPRAPSDPMPPSSRRINSPPGARRGSFYRILRQAPPASLAQQRRGQAAYSQPVYGPPRPYVYQCTPRGQRLRHRRGPQYPGGSPPGTPGRDGSNGRSGAALGFLPLLLERKGEVAHDHHMAVQVLKFPLLLWRQVFPAVPGFLWEVAGFLGQGHKVFVRCLDGTLFFLLAGNGPFDGSQVHQAQVNISLEIVKTALGGHFGKDTAQLPALNQDVPLIVGNADEKDGFLKSIGGLSDNGFHAFLLVKFYF